MKGLQYIWICVLLGVVLGLTININNNLKEIIQKDAPVSCVIVGDDSDEEYLE